MTTEALVKPTRKQGFRTDGTVNCPNMKGRKGFLPKALHPVNPKRLTPEQRAEKTAALLKLKAELQEKLAQVQAQDPFWWFAPTEAIPAEGLALLRKWLTPEDVPQRLDSQMEVFSSEAEITLVAGGNQCLAGETPIYDPMTTLTLPIAERHEPFHVWAYDGRAKRMVIAHASASFRKAPEMLYRVHLSSGESFVASRNHRVLTKSGFIAIGDLASASGVFRPRTIEEAAQRVHVGDDPHWTRIVPDSQVDYRVEPHCGDEPPRWDQDTDQDGLPSRDDVLERRAPVAWQMDDREYRSGHSHLCRLCAPLSNRDDLDPIEALDDAPECLRDDTPGLHSDSYTRVGSQSRREFSPQQSTAVSDRPATVLQISSSLNASCYVEVISVHEERVDDKWDLTVPEYHNFWAAGVIHHNSGKTTTICIDTLIQMTGQVPDALKGRYPEEKLRVPRPFLVRQIGQDYENGLLKNVIPTYRKWSPKEYLINGTWEDSYSAEQRTVRYVDPKTKQLLGIVEFMSNQQDVQSFQGPPRHRINLDEQPRYEVFRENLARFTTSNRVNIWFGMTPTEGLTWVKDEVLDAANQSDGKIRAFALTSVMNPAANLSAVDSIMAGLSSYEEIKMRLLGEFVSLSGLVYGKLFHRDVHVIAPFETRCTCGKGSLHPMTCPAAQFYVIRGIDPHLVTPTAVVWVAMDREGHKYVDTCLFRDADTATLKREIADLSKGMRLGWSACDKSSNSDIKAFGDRNIFRELAQGVNAITGLRTSEKFVGSIRAGVDEIKQDLMLNPATGKPTLFIMDRPENRPLIQAFRTMERERWANEDVKGPKDKISEGKYHHHAALRYCYQFPMHWQPETVAMPSPELFDEVALW